MPENDKGSDHEGIEHMHDYVLPPRRKKNCDNTQAASSNASLLSSPTSPQINQVIEVEVHQVQVVEVEVHRPADGVIPNEHLPGTSGQTSAVLSNAERCRRYRQKIKSRALPQTTTSTQRVREHRARKRKLLPEVTAKDQGSIQKPTSTNRVRAFRERQKQCVPQKNYDEIVHLPLSSESTTETSANRLRILQEQQAQLILQQENYDTYKRENVRSAGVAIYKNTSTTNVVTSHMQVTLRHVVEIDVGQSNVGDICAAQCTLEDGSDIVMIVVYISPKQNIENIIKFLHRRLIIYSKLVSQKLESDLHKMPIMLSGDFNINFASEQAQPLIQFLNDKFELKMNNDPLKCTIKSGTIIDAVFSRYLHKHQSTTYITYFGYHKPIISFLESKSNVNITEITDYDN